MRKYVLGWAQEHWLFNVSQAWDQINKYMIFTVWDEVTIRLNEWCCWLVYLSKYTSESIYSKDHMNIDYLMQVSIGNESKNRWLLLNKMETISDLMNDAVD